MKNELRVVKGSLFQRTIKETSQTAELFDLADIKEANGIMILLFLEKSLNMELDWTLLQL